MQVRDRWKKIDGPYSRVGTSVSHREQARLGMAVDEVLIGELLTVDGAATGTLGPSQPSIRRRGVRPDKHGAKYSHCGG